MFDHGIKAGQKSATAGPFTLGYPCPKGSKPMSTKFFSRTIIVTLQNGEELVIQSRPEPLDLESFEVARRVLGPVVPDIKLLRDEELEGEDIWAYWMTRVRGKTWHKEVREKSKKRVTINWFLGQSFSKGHAEGSSELVINQKVRPHLALLLSSEYDQIGRFRDVASNLLGKLDRLKILPLFTSHFDINGFSVIVDDDCKDLGTVDWELSTPLPFGMGFSCHQYTCWRVFRPEHLHATRV